MFFYPKSLVYTAFSPGHQAVVGMGSLLWPQITLFLQVLCHHCPSTSCRKNKLQVKDFVPGLVSQIHQNTAWLQKTAGSGFLSSIPRNPTQGHPVESWEFLLYQVSTLPLPTHSNSSLFCLFLHLPPHHIPLGSHSHLPPVHPQNQFYFTFPVTSMYPSQRPP